LSHGRALRSPSGRPSRFIALNTDITARKRAEHVLSGIARGVFEARGEEFFQKLVRSFAGIVGTREAFITQCLDEPPTRARMLAYWCDGAFVPGVDFDLAGTSCDATIQSGELTIIHTGVSSRYPMEAQYNRDSYVGVPIFDHGGRVIGHIACYDPQPLNPDAPKLPIFTIFSVRAGVEMEYRILARRLEENGKASQAVTPAKAGVRS
jgi:hypothetical protein